MMIYVVSDLHGVPLKQFEQMIDKASITESDVCYVLGDVIDRGDSGIELLEWLMAHDNFKLLLGNHEDMMLDCESVLDKLINNSELSQSELDRFSMWYYNGAHPTISALVGMTKERRKKIFDYVKGASLYESITVGGRNFILSHSGLENFKVGKPLVSYTKEELLWNRPQLNDKFYSDKTLVFGHTPTLFYGEEYAGRAMITDSFINVDAGVACGLNPMILRLDDMCEFYAE